MGNEIMKREELVKAIQEEGVTSLIKPLVKEIALFETYIAAPDDKVGDLQPGERLLLRREKSKFDDSAIAVLNEKKEKLGYIPEKDNAVFARLLEAGKLLTGEVKEVGAKRGFPLAHITIYLVDY